MGLLVEMIGDMAMWEKTRSGDMAIFAKKIGDMVMWGFWEDKFTIGRYGKKPTKCRYANIWNEI